MEKIKTNLSELFDEVFTEELTTNGGYEIVDEVADNVMRITPRIVDLDVYAPDTPTVGINRQFTGISRQDDAETRDLRFGDAVT